MAALGFAAWRPAVYVASIQHLGLVYQICSCLSVFLLLSALQLGTAAGARQCSQRWLSFRGQLPAATSSVTGLAIVLTALFTSQASRAPVKQPLTAWQVRGLQISVGACAGFSLPIKGPLLPESSNFHRQARWLRRGET